MEINTVDIACLNTFPQKINFWGRKKVGLQRNMVLLCLEGGKQAEEAVFVGKARFWKNKVSHRDE